MRLKYCFKRNNVYTISGMIAINAEKVRVCVCAKERESKVSMTNGKRWTILIFHNKKKLLECIGAIDYICSLSIGNQDEGKKSGGGEGVKCRKDGERERERDASHRSPITQWKKAFSLRCTSATHNQVNAIFIFNGQIQLNSIHNKMCVRWMQATRPMFMTFNVVPDSVVPLVCLCVCARIPCQPSRSFGCANANAFANVRIRQPIQHGRRATIYRYWCV